MAFASDSRTAPARPLLPLPAFDRRAIGRDGWARARELAARLGGEIRAHLAEGLRQAWRAARAAVGASPAAQAARAKLPPEPLLSTPAPLPSLVSALSRRRAIFGAVTLAAAPAAALQAAAHSAPIPALSPNDARLVALADAYEALDSRVNAMSSEAPGFDELISRYSDLETDAAETPADSFAGALAKVRLCRSPTAQGCATFEHIVSALDDVWRLRPAGGLA